MSLPLRGSKLVSEMFVIARVAFSVVATILFVVLFATYLRFRSRRLLLTLVGFGFFFAHAMFTLPEILNSDYAVMFDDTVHLLLDAIGLFFIMLGTLQDAFKKKLRLSHDV